MTPTPAQAEAARVEWRKVEARVRARRPRANPWPLVAYAVVLAAVLVLA